MFCICNVLYIYSFKLNKFNVSQTFKMAEIKMAV